MRWLLPALLAGIWCAPVAHAQDTAGGSLTGQDGQAERPSPRAEPLPRYALGFAFAVGGQHHPLSRVPMVDLLVFELRWFLDANHSLDLQVDRMQLWLSRAATSEPRLGLSTSYALRRDVGRRFGWVVAPGLDLDIGADALVIDEQLAWRPRVSPALSVRGGLELRTQSKRMNYGLVLHAAVGREHRRLMVETKFTWNGLLR
jgi:hypothetical protein